MTRKKMAQNTDKTSSFKAWVVDIFECENSGANNCCMRCSLWIIKSNYRKIVTLICRRTSQWVVRRTRQMSAVLGHFVSSGIPRDNKVEIFCFKLVEDSINVSKHTEKFRV